MKKGPIQGSVCFKLVFGLLVARPFSKVGLMGLMSAQNDTNLSANSISLLFKVGSKGAQSDTRFYVYIIKRSIIGYIVNTDWFSHLVNNRPPAWTIVPTSHWPLFDDGGMLNV